MKQELQIGCVNPMLHKLDLATAIVECYHGGDVAQKEREWFVRVFSERGVPEGLPVVILEQTEPTVLQLLHSCLPSRSMSELRRLVQQGAVEANGQKLLDPSSTVKTAGGLVLKVGKRSWFRIKGRDHD